MSKNLYLIVKGCQQNKEDCFEKVYDMFLPLFRKYSNGFYDREDAFDTLVYSFVLCLYQMLLENERFQHDGVIVSYISTTIRNRYYLLCKEESKNSRMVCSYEELQIEQTDEDFSMEDEILLLSLKKYLTESEIALIKYKFFDGYRDSEIAKYYGISRQATNKKIHKVINKIRKLYEERRI